RGDELVFEGNVLQVQIPLRKRVSKEQNQPGDACQDKAQKRSRIGDFFQHDGLYFFDAVIGTVLSCTGDPVAMASSLAIRLRGPRRGWASFLWTSYQGVNSASL